MKTVEQFDGAYGVTIDEQFGELVDFLNGKHVIEDREEGEENSVWGLVKTTYSINGVRYQLCYQVINPNTYPEFTGTYSFFPVN
jgi:hypothetical protein